MREREKEMPNTRCILQSHNIKSYQYFFSLKFSLKYGLIKEWKWEENRTKLLTSTVETFGKKRWTSKKCVYLLQKNNIPSPLPQRGKNESQWGCIFYFFIYIIFFKQKTLQDNQIPSHCVWSGSSSWLETKILLCHWKKKANPQKPNFCIKALAEVRNISQL